MLNIRKKQEYSFLILLVACLFSANSQAQTIGDLRPIVAPTYGLEAKNLGVTVGAEYLLLDNFGTALSYEKYFMGKNITFRAFQIDGRYYFRPGQLQFYGLLGYTRNTTESPLQLKITKGGLNIGLGTVYRLMFSDRIALFAQAKYSTPNSNQFSGMAGVTYLLSLF